MRLLLTLSMLLLTLQTFAASTFTLPSRTFDKTQGDVVIPFKTPINLDPAYGTMFGNVVMAFFIDVQYVDMEISKKDGSTFRVSFCVNIPDCTISFGTIFFKLAPETGGVGTTIGMPTRLGEAGTTLFKIQLGIAVGAQFPYTSPMGNVVVCADDSLLRFVAHTNAIAQLPGGLYQMGLNPTKSIIRAGSLTPANHPLTLDGGTFIVPEPSALIALASGIGGLLILRRR